MSTTDSLLPSGAFTDCVQHFQVEGPGLRGRMVRIGPSLQQALNAHNFPESVARLLGETVSVTVTLASVLKYDGIFTLQAIGDGAIKTLMADITSDGVFRCYARFDRDVLTDVLKSSPDPSLPRLMGAGHLAFTVEGTERYQGITELTGSTLADCVHHYFRQSEQLQTAMVVMCDADAGVSGSIMIQRMPEESDDWRRAVALMSSVKPAELLDWSLAPSDLLFRLFHEDGVRLFGASPLRNQCRCSADKVRNTLKSFPRMEIDEMRKDGIVTVTCEFCKINYAFDDAVLDSLYA